MAGNPPKWRAYLTDENGDMLKDENNKWVEFAALWVNRNADKNGNFSYSGATGKGKQRLLIFENAPKERFAEDVGEDKPF